MSNKVSTDGGKMTKTSMADIDCEFHDEAIFWWHRNYQSVATATLMEDGTLLFKGHNHDVEIRNIGTSRERVVIKKCADLVV